MNKGKEKEFCFGTVIGEFQKADEAEGGYTNKIKRLYILEGWLPGNGGWQAVCLSDTGFIDQIPAADLTRADGRYIVGGAGIIMRAAGMLDTADAEEDPGEGGEDDGEEKGDNRKERDRVRL